MTEKDFFQDRGERPALKIYSILKRERSQRSLLRRPQNFSWPPRKNAVRASGRQRGDTEDK